MNTFAKIFGTLVAAVLLMQTPAFAQDFCSNGTQTFTATSLSVINSSDSGDLQIGWTETGLLPGTYVTYTLSGHASATYICVLNGAIITTQTPVVADVTKGAVLPVTKKGNISQKGWLDEPLPNESCAPGETQLLYSVDWTEAAIEDNTNLLGPCPAAGTQISATFCTSKNVRNCPSPT